MTNATNNSPLNRLRHHVTGAIERGEAEAIVGVEHKLDDHGVCLIVHRESCETQRQQMSKVEHTPTPWRTIQIDTETANGITSDKAEPSMIATTHDYVEDDGSREAEANAALIVRAVNSHEALVEALSRLRSKVEEWAESEDSDGHSEIVNWPEMNHARAALRLADRGKLNGK